MTDDSLSSTTRRREIAASIAQTVLVAAAITVFYFLIPFTRVSALDTALRLGGGLVIILLAVGWQVRSIRRARLPLVRAVEALGLVTWILVIVFSIVYVSLSAVDPAAFSEPLREVGGLYFTVTVLSTVGFGDIVPVSDAARVVVSVQMLFDLILLGVIVRLFLRAASPRGGKQS